MDSRFLFDWEKVGLVAYRHPTCCYLYRVLRLWARHFFRSELSLCLTPVRISTRRIWNLPRDALVQHSNMNTPPTKCLPSSKEYIILLIERELGKKLGASQMRSCVNRKFWHKFSVTYCLGEWVSCWRVERVNCCENARVMSPIFFRAITFPSDFESNRSTVLLELIHFTANSFIG